MSFPSEPTDEQRDELVEEVAREIQLRGLTSSAVLFLEASRPYRALGSNAMLFFDPVLRGVFGGDLAVALERASAFCRVVSAGRADVSSGSEAAEHAANLLSMADDLAASARLWRAEALD